MSHLRACPFVLERLTSGKDSGHRRPAEGPSVVQESIQHGPAGRLSLTRSPEPEMQREGRD